MTVALGEVCSFQSGGTPARSVKRFFAGTVPWITGADITSPVVQAARTYITNEAIEKSATSRVPEGTVLLVTRTSVGKVAIAGVDLCFSQDITALCPDRNRLDRSFLAWFLRSKAAHLDRQARGATIRGITREAVAELKLSLPLLREQRRIADILDQVEALRSKRRAAGGLLGELPRAVFLNLFGDPVANSKRWPVSSLGDLGDLDRGVSKHRPRNSPELLGGQYPLVQTGEVANCDGYLREYKSTYSEVGLRQSRLWPAGTLCITIAANIAKTGVLEFDACFPDSVVGFRSDQVATTEYVRIWFSFLQKRLEEAAPESAQKNINLAILRALPVPTPPVELQREFARRVAAIEELKSLHRTSLAKLDELFASLQHRAFRGEL